MNDNERTGDQKQKDPPLGLAESDVNGKRCRYRKSIELAYDYIGL